MTAGRVRLNGELVTEPYTPAPRGTTIGIALD
jgi:hypothetical protein